jgi:hypothetical protein
MNKWTLGLAALGLVSVPAALQAEEKMNQVWTSLSSTTIEGYVNTSIHWDLGSGNARVPGYSFNSGKQDGFNLNAVKLAISKPLDESSWAAGYRVELLAGPDAAAFNTTPGSTNSTGNDFAIKSAYVTLRAPVGNGLDAKIGVFDTVIGYETFDAGSNPNYTRSYGYTIEPTTHTGVLLSYQISSLISASAGIANTYGPVINQRANPPKAESYKTYLGSVALTAPEDWGSLAGSTLYFAVINGFNSSATDNQTSWYVGTTINTPIEGFKVGASYDYAGGHSAASGSFYANAAALYASMQLSEKMSLHLRGEYAWTDTSVFGDSFDPADPVFIAQDSGAASRFLALTGTLQYDLWQNVISRLEFRWDHQAGDSAQLPFGGVPGETTSTATKRNAYLLAANFIYKF